MNKKQKDVISKLYNSYLKGEKYLKNEIQKRIQELEIDVNWKRELVSDDVNIIIEGYISKNRPIFCSSNYIVFDDDEVYYMFLKKLFNDTFNIEGKVYSKIKRAVIDTIKQYFGDWYGNEEERKYRRNDNYRPNRSESIIGISKFKDVGIEFCLERALLVQNVLAFLEVETYLITTNVIMDELNESDEYIRHAFNVIKFDGKTRMFDCSLGLDDIYDKYGKYIKQELFDAELYNNDIHRIANGSLIKIKEVKYGMGYHNSSFLRILQTRLFNTEYDNEYLNKVVGGTRNLKREKETYSANTVMAHSLLPDIFINQKEKYNILKEMINKNDGSMENYINKIYLEYMHGFTKQNSKMMDFNTKVEIRNVEYDGKETNMVIFRLPMADKRIYKFESKYVAIVLDDKFPRYFNLSYGYPDKKIESKDCVLYEVINGLSIDIGVINNDRIDTFVNAIKEEIGNKNNVLERKFEETIFNEYFDMKFEVKTYKLALDIYNKKLMKPDLETNRNQIRFETKISCEKCNRYITDIDEYPTAYSKNDYLGYYDSYAMNFKCEFSKYNILCPFRFLCFIENLLKNTNISVKYVLEKLIKLQEERIGKNEEI